MQNEDFVFQPFSICDVHFRNPFFVASGPTTRNLRQLQKAEECGWGGASIKLTISPAPYINREPRYGWFANQGIFAFTTEKRLTPDKGLKLVEEARKHTSELIIMGNITYAGEEDIEKGWADLARQFEAAGAHIIELNMCCPNMSYNVELSQKCDISGPKTGASLGQNAKAVKSITRAVVDSVSIPVFVKLTPEGGRIAQVAKASFEAGADAVGGTANRMAIPPFDIYNPQASPYALQKEISLSCFSGEWLKPLALRDVFEIRKLVGDGPVITAAGGIRNFEDVIQMTYMGANLFGICSETIISGFGFLEKIIRDLRAYLDETDYTSLDELRGSLVSELKSAQTVTLSKGHARVKDRTLSAPCVVSCPNHVPAQGYVMAVAREDFRKAYDLITSSGPLQSVCGYACNHPCESVCIRGNIDDTVRIREIKRFVLDYGFKMGWSPSLNLSPKKGIKVAIIGSGPSGLAAAYYLQLAGYDVTIFEKEEKAGGLLRHGLPEYRLPTKIVDYEVNLVKLSGVSLKTSQEFLKDFTLAQLSDQGFSAVILAFGADESIPLEVPEETKEGYYTAVEFLRNVHDGQKPPIGKTVVIIGGGFSAFDAARTSVRLGAKEVYIAYRRTRDEMPASLEEIKEAEEEGVKIMYLVSPKEIITENGKIKSIRLVNYILGEEDASYRRKPVEVKGTEFSLKADTVISALGQKVKSFSDPLLDQLTQKGRIETDPDTGKTVLPGVYAIGDAALGASDIISAVGSAKQAAAAVDRDLSGEKAIIRKPAKLNEIERNYVLESKGNAKRTVSVKNYTKDADKRRDNFDTYTRPLTKEEAVKEAGRCLNCGCGEGCMLCVDLCNSFAIQNAEGRPEVTSEDCVGCGICVWRCPNDNIEMIEG
jgi:NADPH-dependent glutamate synthase beta subunit-like oxidoreductase/dihydroorotate dehydrogenase